MRKMKLFFLVAMIGIGGLYYIIQTSDAHGRMIGMGMGQGMMGGARGEAENATGNLSSSRASALLNYIQDQHLQCLQCHAVSTGGFGPSFASVSVKYANIKNATSILDKNIEHGIGRMPPGLANNAQASQLAKLILGLTDSKPKN